MILDLRHDSICVAKAVSLERQKKAINEFRLLVAPSKRSDLSGHCGVCMDGCMYVCSLVRQFLVRQLSNRKINHILTYTKEYFLTADLA